MKDPSVPNQLRTSHTGYDCDTMSVQRHYCHQTTQPTSQTDRQAKLDIVDEYLLLRYLVGSYSVGRRRNFNPLKGSGVRCLHFEVFSAIQV